MSVSKTDALTTWLYPIFFYFNFFILRPTGIFFFKIVSNLSKQISEFFPGLKKSNLENSTNSYCSFDLLKTCGDLLKVKVFVFEGKGTLSKLTKPKLLIKGLNLLCKNNEIIWELKLFMIKRKMIEVFRTE